MGDARRERERTVSVPFRLLRARTCAACPSPSPPSYPAARRLYRSSLSLSWFPRSRFCFCFCLLPSPLLLLLLLNRLQSNPLLVLASSLLLA